MENELVEYTNQLYRELARLGKGLASDRRLEILNLLTQSPKSVEMIAKETGTSVANTSRHLQILKNSHLVKTAKDGNRVIYRLGSAKIVQLVQLLISVGEDELSEMQTIEREFDHVEGVKTVTLDKAIDEQKDSLLLDVRPSDEYDAGHIKGAINIPLDQLESNLDQLPRQRQIIVYCRGRLCAYSNQATRYLNEQGFNAWSLNNTYQEWQSVIKQ